MVWNARPITAFYFSSSTRDHQQMARVAQPPLSDRSLGTMAKRSCGYWKQMRLNWIMKTILYRWAEGRGQNGGSHGDTVSTVTSGRLPARVSLLSQYMYVLTEGYFALN